jgi:hypothetical protein
MSESGKEGYLRTSRWQFRIILERTQGRFKPRRHKRRKHIRDNIKHMLVEEIEPFIKAQPSHYDEPAIFCLTINKSTRKGQFPKTTWNGGYEDYGTHLILLHVSEAESLDEFAIRLKARLERYLKQHPDALDFENM